MMSTKSLRIQPLTGHDSWRQLSPSMHVRARFSASSRPTLFDVQSEKTCIDRELNRAGMLVISCQCLSMSKKKKKRLTYGLG